MPFAYPHLNLIAILVAAAAQFVLGWVWYSNATPIGKRWLAESGRNADETAKPGAEMLIFVAGAILSAWVIAMVYGWSGAKGAVDGICVALTVAVAVVVQQLMQGVAMGTQSRALTLINVGYVIVGYAISGAIIASM